MRLQHSNLDRRPRSAPASLRLAVETHHDTKPRQQAQEPMQRRTGRPEVVRANPADLAVIAQIPGGNAGRQGAAVQVPVEVTCNATGSAFVQVTVTQKAGSSADQGFGSTQIGCTGAGEQITVLVQTTGAKTFKKGDAVASAEIFGCNNVTSAARQITRSSSSNREFTDLFLMQRAPSKPCLVIGVMPHVWPESEVKASVAQFRVSARSQMRS
jgi:hypothetical protein